METPESTLTEEESAGLTDLIETFRANMDDMVRARQEVMERLVPGLVSPDMDHESEAKAGMNALESAVRSGDLSGYYAEQRARTAELADQGIPFGVVGRALTEVVNPVAGALESSYPDDPERSIRALKALHKLEREFLLMAGGAYASTREDAVESEYLHAIRRLSTPVIEVWDEVLVMPLIGVLDTSRAQQMMEHLLERIVERQSRFVLVDITGVPTVDTAVAEHLIKTTKAGNMVGAETILVGISPQVAQTLVRLGVSLGDIATFTDLRSGLQYVFKALGYQIERHVS